MNAQFEGELSPPRALLPPCLLLLLAEAPGHGYQLMERLKPLGFEWKGPGPIYRELRELEEAGLVTSAWMTPTAGPVPRVYELTEAGREALDRSGGAMRDLQAMTCEYLARYRGVSASDPSPTSASGKAPSRRRRPHRGGS